MSNKNYTMIVHDVEIQWELFNDFRADIGDSRSIVQATKYKYILIDTTYHRVKELVSFPVVYCSPRCGPTSV